MSTSVDKTLQIQVSVWLPWALLASLIPVYLVFLLAPGFGYYHDDRVYLVNAFSLASGHGYRVLSLPSEIYQTKYPPLYAGCLAIIWKAFGALTHRVIAAKALSLLGTVLWLGTLYPVIRRETGSAGVARWIIVFTAASPWVLHLTGSIMPDSLFAFSWVAAIYFMSDAAPSLQWSNLILAAIATGVACSLRTAGLPILFAGCGLLLWRRMTRKAIVFLAISVLMLLPWILWQAHHPASTDPIEQYYTKANYIRGHIFAGYTASQASSVVFQNLVNVALGSFPPATCLGLPGAYFSLGVGVLIAGGVFLSFRQRVNMLNLSAALYLGLILCWVWWPQRYLMPLTPLLLLFAWEAVRWVGRHIARRSIRHAVAATAIVAFSAHGAALAVDATRRTESERTPSFPKSEFDDWGKITQLSAWIRVHTPADAVIAANEDPVFYLLTGRKCVRPFSADFFTLVYSGDKQAQPLGSTRETRNNLLRHDVQFLVLTPMKTFAERPYLLALLQPLVLDGSLRIVNQLDDPRYVIYAIDRSRLAQAEPAMPKPQKPEQEVPKETGM